MTTTSNIVHNGDVGTKFDVLIIDRNTGAVVDISLATLKQINFRKGDTSILGPLTAAFDATNGVDGVIRYVSVSGDIIENGDWIYWGYVETPFGKYTSDPIPFKVISN